MINGRILTCLLFFFLLTRAAEGKEIQETEDLRLQWKIYRGNQLVPYDAGPAKSIHLALDLAGYEGHYLKLSSRKRFYVFINSALVAKAQDQFFLSADSLRRMYGNTVLVSIYQRDGINDLAVKWVVKTLPDDLQNFKRPSAAFPNFLLMASLVLIIYFTALFRTNPQLAIDYLNVSKLFYFKDRDDHQITLRIASSVNLLFYLFCSLFGSLAILTAAHFSDRGLSIVINSSVYSAVNYLLQWLFLALGIAGLLMLKLGLSSALGSLFGWRDVAGFQFFNFVRVTILSLALIATATVFCFALGIRINYFFLLQSSCVLMALGVVLLFFKLLARNQLHSFHLFSYLCATEIFPLMVLVKILLF
jgi:hypothetical protein